MTIIRAKKDLYNGGKCFTKGKKYRVEANLRIPASLMEAQTFNDQGEPHVIGNWWRDFEITNK